MPIMVLPLMSAKQEHAIKEVFDGARRYARQTILPDIGKEGQEKLLKSKVIVIGAGGLGSPALLYLAASGVGTLGIIDGDKVEISNLQRQIIHETGDIGRKKAESAKDAIEDLNPDVKVIIYPERITSNNAEKIINDYDLVVDGSDNIETRFLINDICFKLKKTLISAAILKYEGQISTYKAYLKNGHPCYRCLYPEPPPQDAMPSCSTNGILAPVAGVMGAMQAQEVIKEILGIGESLSGYLLVYDGLKMESRKVKLNKDKNCPLCKN